MLLLIYNYHSRNNTMYKLESRFGPLLKGYIPVKHQIKILMGSHIQLLKTMAIDLL